MLVLENLAKTYGGFRLGPVDLSVSDEVLTVLGPSGCGKTTLLSIVAGTVQPDGGSISLDGRVLDGRPPEDRQTGLVFQDGALFPHMTARENVAYAATDASRVAELAETLEVESVLDQRATTLSGGERQRVALARALAADPDALLLDEPLTNLDAPIRRRLRDKLHELFASLSIPVVYVTHDQRAATALGDRIAVFHDGAVEQVGPPSEILDRPATPFVAAFTGSENVFEAQVVDHEAEDIVLEVGDRRLCATGTEPVGTDVTVCIRSTRLSIRRPSDGQSPRDGTNDLDGTVTRRLYEGDAYRLTLAVEGLPATLTATVPPATVERLSLAPDSAVRVSVAPDALYVID